MGCGQVRRRDLGEVIGLSLWYWLSLAAPALWATCNYIDRYVLTRHMEQDNLAQLVFIAGVFGGLVSLVLFALGVDSSPGSYWAKGILGVNGALLTLAFVPYLCALKEHEIGVTVPILQSVPVFGFAIGFAVLRETLSANQVIASIIVLAGGIGLSLDVNADVKLKIRPLLLMLSSAFVLALTNIVFKLFASGMSYWSASLWQYLGASSVPLVMYLGSKKVRAQVASLFTDQRSVLLLSSTQEILNISGNMIASYAFLLAPVALVGALANGTQPLWVIILAPVFGNIWPSLRSHRTTGKVVAYRVTFTLIVVAGSLMLHLS